MRAFYLFTVEECQRGEPGLIVKRGIPLTEFSKRPEIQDMRKGTPLELHYRDGRIGHTKLVEFGMVTQVLADGESVMEDMPHLHVVLPASMDVSDVPPGTEIWWTRP